ncbi:asparagine synthase (glutamine-hydrolyzing) [Rhizosphaericola mali]|uniref:asparagine synthase (glutamine-hydrolyzing) n=1 Tax=Rhizosphaericola mali TaxID=2545455 RepID=A0A5P2G0X3_9BACT|nr:asparagine synthase (glutamine-hydrolyzing) [Rhizosphaericola mali]QES87470.1 asparagine synthase (glutamine-hydrolyzing) [Rhizosphaericola mali]
MCGIAGIISPYPQLVVESRLHDMANSLIHRGPESEGFYLNDTHQIGFAHRRLAIIEKNSQGNQPFQYLHYTLVFNGEIYNYKELKIELGKVGYHFQTSSDTEVIPAAYDYWKIKFLDHLDGMFALALYDANEENIIVARDRFGEKPLYYYADYKERGRFEKFLFASEMKALWAAEVPKSLDGTMMLNYLSLGYVQNPHKKMATFYSNILSLPPGHYLKIFPKEGRVQMRNWYRLKYEAPDLEISEKDAIEKFQLLLNNSVEKRLRSDVTLGASLSGGIDSASIVSLMQKNGAKDFKTFTAIFPGFSNDESKKSKEISNHLQLSNYTVTPTAPDIYSELQHLCYHQEEPFQSASIFTQYKVYQRAQQEQVTVLLDGQGADEILGGYSKYIQWFLQYLFRTDKKLFKKEKPLFVDNYASFQWTWSNYAAAQFPNLVAKKLTNRTIKSQNSLPFNQEFIAHYQSTDILEKPNIFRPEDLMYYNIARMGLEELLRYADRNSMAWSREVRLPYLQHELVEFLFTLPSHLKFQNGFTKSILRKSVDNILPENIVWQKGKIGYEPPQKQWIQSDPMQGLLFAAKEKLVQEKIFQPKILQTHLPSADAHSTNNLDWKILNSSFFI